MKVPKELIFPLPAFEESYAAHAHLGRQVAADANVVFVGLARNCADHLAGNLVRLESLAEAFASWRLHVETNDNDDDTDQVLLDFCTAHRQATFTSQTLGRQQYTTEFAGRRTEALAEYRTACQRWVRDNARDADYVIVIDFDAWGGWSHQGVLAGLGWLQATPDAYGMASVSLLQHYGKDQVLQWLQYDCWALRLNCSWDDYTAGIGGWKHVWIPPVGSPPVPVASAFGGMAIYDAYVYLKGVYDGRDCEHVTFHATAAEKTGQRMYLCPSMRTVMRWDSPNEGTDAGNGFDSL
jgi:hypothetical protein